ncbi:MAG TPA: LysR substrate-binding domain-containing protein [Planctomycetota bacterium]|nr:LysR substrate-binding domain-containing protein [Planctomycetota bacterium]
MELRHLRYFVSVATELSFSQAAKKLHISQPPLSQQIRDLERETGLELFDRSRRKIMLTQAGHDFLSDVKEVLDAVARLERRARQRAEGQIGHLTIGVNMGIISPHFFATTMRAFQRRHAGIKISLLDYLSVRQIEALMSGEIDAGFLRLPSQIPPQLETHRIKREATRIAVPVGHPLAKRHKIEWTELTDARFILIQPDVSRTFYEEFYLRCRTAGFEPKVEQYAFNIATQLWLVSAGLGVAPLPMTPEITKRSGVRFVALPGDAPIYETVMAWRRDDLSPALQRFVQFVRRGE